MRGKGYVMLVEDWLRGCVHHDGRHGEVTLPCDRVLEIADYIESTRSKVEVVRCRDCKYAEENWNGKDIYCLRTSSFPWSNDSFCSDGERKDGEQE